MLERIDGNVAGEVDIASHGQTSASIQYGIVTDNCAIAKSKPFGASHLRTEVYGYVLSHFHTQSLIQPYTQMYGWDGRNLKEHESAPPNLRKCSATRRGNRMIFFIFGLLWQLPKADNAMSG